MAYEKDCLISIKPETESGKDHLNELNNKPWIGTMVLGTYLELNGYEPIILDVAYNKSVVEKMVERIMEEKPILIGISVFTENFKKAMNIARELKVSCPNIPIVLGGSHPSLCPRDGISSRYVDFTIVKEGEATMTELARAIITNERQLRYDDIPGLVFKRGNKIVENKRRKSIADLDLLPIVKREYANIDRYEGLINVSSSRGCPANCIYCAATALSGASYRIRDVKKNTFMEFVLLKAVMGDRLKEIFITDDTFTEMSGRVFEFAEMMKRYNLDVFWRCESRIDAMSKEMIQKMSEAGCVGIQYGIESGNQDVLDNIKKNIKLENVMSVIDYTYEAGVFVCLSFMLGHYCDTMSTMMDTVKLIKNLHKKYKKIELVLGYNTPFPGTWQYTRLEKLGMRYVKEQYDEMILIQPVIETDKFTVKDQIQLFNVAYPYLWHLERGYIRA